MTVFCYSKISSSIYKIDVNLDPKKDCIKKFKEECVNRLNELGFNVDIFDISVCFSLDELPKYTRKKLLYNI